MSRNRSASFADYASFKNLETVDTVLKVTKARAQARHTIIVPSVVDLNMNWVDSSPQLPGGGYMARIDGKDLPVSEGAYRSACKMIKANPKHFKLFSDRTAFPQAMRNILDNPARTGPKGVMVRTGIGPNHINEEIAAILPPDYEVRDAHTQIADFADMLSSTMGEVKGMNALDKTHGNLASYRMLVGGNIMPKTTDDKGQYMMFILSMSETGQCQDKTTLGLYRVVCNNGAMRMDSHEMVSDWDHSSAKLSDYLSRTGRTINHASYYSQNWGKIFSELLDTPVPAPAADILYALSKTKLITRNHYEDAKVQLMTGPVNTQYDIYNVLTSSAQGMKSIQARQQAESSALRLFTAPGGVMEQLRQKIQGNTNRPSNQPLVLPPAPEDEDDGEGDEDSED